MRAKLLTITTAATRRAVTPTVQTHLNTALSREGYKPINADGKLGPATCGAFKTVGGAHPSLFTSDPIANLRICQAWTNPTKVGQTKPVSDPVSPIAAELDQKYGQLPWGKPDERVANLQQQINAQLTGHGLKPIGVSGMLDSATCGAMRFLDRETGSRWMATWDLTSSTICWRVRRSCRESTADCCKYRAISTSVCCTIGLISSILRRTAGTIW